MCSASAARPCQLVWSTVPRARTSALDPQHRDLSPPWRSAAVVIAPGVRYSCSVRPHHRQGPSPLASSLPLVLALVASGCSDDEGDAPADRTPLSPSSGPTDSAAPSGSLDPSGSTSPSGALDPVDPSPGSATNPQPPAPTPTQPDSSGSPVPSPADGPCVQPPPNGSATPDQPSPGMVPDAGAGGAGGAAGNSGSGGDSTQVDPAGQAAAGTGGASNPGFGGAAGTPGADPGPSCENGKVVHFVYFVEADQQYDESQRDDIQRYAFTFQSYWFEQLGVTFYLNDPVVEVIEADHDSTWYVETPDGIHADSRWYRLGNIKNEVYEKLRIRDFDPNHRVINYPTTRFDGRVGGNFGGVWMDGDDLTCIANDGPTYPYDDANPAHCLGHPAHEFGHVLGLDHEGPETDCMQYGFYLSSGGPGMCDFSDANIQKILDNPSNDGWFLANPGDTCSGIW